jgi:Ribonuclease G/E
MTRQNISDGPREVMTEPCEPCNGVGISLSDETVAIDASRAIVRAAMGVDDDQLGVQVSVRAAALLNDDGRARVAEIEELVAKRIHLDSDRGLHDGAVRVRAHTTA